MDLKEWLLSKHISSTQEGHKGMLRLNHPFLSCEKLAAETYPATLPQPDTQECTQTLCGRSFLIGYIVLIKNMNTDAGTPMVEV
jgi:hypothetical protein